MNGWIIGGIAAFLLFCVALADSPGKCREQGATWLPREGRCYSGIHEIRMYP